MRVFAALFLFASFLIGACHSGKPAAQSQTAESQRDPEEIGMTGDSLVTASSDTIRIENEELEYEIIILEVGFKNWLVTQRPMWYYSLNLLENRNRYYVLEWNRRVQSPHLFNSNLYNQFINYDPAIEYGLEVNYKLFMYFEFFQQKYRQRL
jgi:hypothetical protein